MGGGMLSGMGGGMSRSRGSASCNNLAAMASAGSSASRPSGLGMGSRAFPPISQTPVTAMGAGSTGDASASAGGEAKGGSSPHEESKFSDLLSRCKQQGMRMSMSVARGISSKPMQQQQ